MRTGIFYLYLMALFSCALFAQENENPQIKKFTQEIQSAMHAKEYAKASNIADNALKACEGNLGYFHYMKALAQHYANSSEDAEKSLNSLFASSDNTWRRKGRYLLAAIYLKRKDYASLQKIYAEEANFLHSAERKKEVAGVYMQFAQVFSYRQDTNELNAQPPDYEKAYTLYKKALELQPGDALIEEILFQMGMSSVLAKNWTRASENLEEYLASFDTDWKGWPTKVVVSRASQNGKHREEARYWLGQCLLQRAMSREARYVLEDFLKFLEKSQHSQKEDFRHETLWQITRSYRLPNPSAEEISSAVASLRTYLKNFPENFYGVRASYEIGEAYMSLSRTDEAIQSFQDFLSGKDYRIPANIPKSKISFMPEKTEEELPSVLQEKFRKQATYKLGKLYFDQKCYDKAIEAWQRYTVQYPHGESWSFAMQGIIDAEYCTGESLIASQKYEEARTCWEKFMSRHPLDSRNSRILYVFGQIRYQSALEEEELAKQNKPTKSTKTVADLFRAAILEWEKLVSKYPNSDEAQSAIFMCGQIYEDKLKELANALKTYKRVLRGINYEEAQQKIKSMTSKDLALSTDRIYRTDETARVRAKLRNIQNLTVEIYRINMNEYFRKAHQIKGIENLGISLIEPDKSWDFKVPNYVDYLATDQEIPIPMDTPGVCAVHVSDGELESTTMVVKSDLDLILKYSQQEVLAFVQNMKECRPAKDVSILVTNGKKVLLQGQTNADGVYHGKASDWKDGVENKDGVKNKEAEFELGYDGKLSVFAEQNGNIASNVFYAGVGKAQGLSPKGYIYTDRPAYRPGEQVGIRGILRDVLEGVFVIAKKTRYTFRIFDPKGKCLWEEETTLSEFGTVAKTFALSDRCEVGEYRIEFGRKDSYQTFATTFKVEHLQIQKVRLSLTFAERTVFRGEKIVGTFEARYYYGTPLIGKSIHYTLPDNRSSTAQTDSEGRVTFTFDTISMKPGDTLRFSGILEDEGVKAEETVTLANKGFTIEMTPERATSDQDSVEVAVITKDISQKPVSVRLQVAVYRAVMVRPDPVLEAVRWKTHDMSDTQAEVKGEEKEITTDPKTGMAKIFFKVDRKLSGSYIFRASAQDRFGNPVTGEAFFSFPQEETWAMKIVTSRKSLKMGETLDVEIQSNLQKTLALVTLEGETILEYYVIPLVPGSNKKQIAVRDALFPNFRMTVAAMSQNRLYQTNQEFTVEREMKVELKFDKEEYLPGEKAKVTITTTDDMGKPANAEISLALVDEALFATYPDKRSNIVQFFQEGARRVSTLNTDTSCTFHYEGTTTKVVQEVVQEGERIRREEAKDSRKKSEKIGFVEKPQILGSDLALTMKGPGLIFLNKPAEFAITIANGRDASVFDLQLSAILPRGLDYISSNPRGKFSPALGDAQASVTWKFEEIQAKKIIQIRLTMRANSTGRFATCAKLISLSDSTPIPPLEASYETTIMGIPAMHISSYDTEDPVEIGKETTYVVEVRNEGTSACTNVKMVSDIDDEMEFVSAQGPTPYRLEGEDNKVIFEPVPILQPGEKLVYKITCIAVKEGSAKNSATIMYDQFSKPMTDQEGTSVYNGVPHPVSKSKRQKGTKGVKPQADVRRETKWPGWWNPSVITGDIGMAVIEITMPEKISEWRLVAIGCTRETMVGEARKMAVTKKNFFLDAKLPALFVESDTACVLARIHNLSDYAGIVNLLLEIDFGHKKITQPKKMTIQAGQTTEFTFDSVLIPGVEKCDITVSAQIPDKFQDAVSYTLPVRPLGMEYASYVSGKANASVIRFIGLPDQEHYTNRRMTIAIGPSISKTILDMALEDPSFCTAHVYAGFSSKASDLMVCASALEYASQTKTYPGDYQRLLAKTRSAAASLLSSQKQDGGWGLSEADTNSDAIVSARSIIALSQAQKQGISIPQNNMDNAVEYLKGIFTTISYVDDDSRAIVAYALTLLKKGEFAYANKLYRQRNSLGTTTLAYTALILAEMDKKEMANEILGILEKKKVSGDDSRRDTLWPVDSGSMSGPVETTALVILAFQEIRPGDKIVQEGIEDLLARRRGFHFSPYHTRGFAVAALSKYYLKSQYAQNDYILKVLVNGRTLKELRGFDKTPTAILSIPDAWIGDGQNKVEFSFDGNGTYTYSVTLVGFSRNITDPKLWTYPCVQEREYLHRPLEYEGKSIEVLSTSPVKNLEMGQIAHVSLQFSRGTEAQSPYFVVEEPIPAGTIVMEDSVMGNFTHYEKVPGEIRFYFAPSRTIGNITYDLAGYTPGEYTVLPTIIRDSNNPSRMRIGNLDRIIVLRPGETSKDVYRSNTGELYTLGKLHFQGKKYREALRYFSDLLDKSKIHEQREVARMLLWIYTDKEFYDARKIVDNFEILKERYSELDIPFDKILTVAHAYEDLREYERAYLILYATIEASFVKESIAGGLLEEIGEFLAAKQYAKWIWRHYHDSPSVIQAYLGNAHSFYGKLSEIVGKKNSMRIGGTSVTKEENLQDAISLFQEFLSLYPETPQVDDVCLSMASAYLSLDDFDKAIAVCEKTRRLYPESRFVTTFQYIEALAYFSLQKYDKAIEQAKFVADRDGKDKHYATYILGQIYHARGNIAEALSWYNKVQNQFPDAKETIDYYESKSLTLPEVSQIRSGDRVSVDLEYRNVKDVTLLVYRVDIMKLYLQKKNLADVARIELDGIAPVLTTKVKLEDSRNDRNLKKNIPLAIKEDGSYLVLCQGGEIFSSGLVLITPLHIDVREDISSGRVRVYVTNMVSDTRPQNVHIKAIGSENTRFVSGLTDMRGIFIADNIQGKVTVIARDKKNRYAFYRGTTSLAEKRTETEESEEKSEEESTNIQKSTGKEIKYGFRSNIEEFNRSIRESNVQKFQSQMQRSSEGVRVDEVK